MSVRRVTASVLIVGATLLGRVAAAGPRQKTLEAWESYILRTEARIGAELGSGEGFLARDFLAMNDARECQQAIWSGGVCVYRMEALDASGREISIPSGMVHHWLGSALIPDVSLDELLEWLQDYSKHEERFRDVEASRVLSRKGDRFEIFLRLRQDSIVSVQFNTEHVVEYRRHGRREASSRSVATRISQLENPGGPDEREKPEGQDSGFLWRLNSYWRFQEVAEGVVVECESVALSRSIPFAVRWLVLPFTASIPRESLESTLLSIRTGSAARWVTVRAAEGARTPSERRRQ
jgi:hypothetical protein